MSPGPRSGGDHDCGGQGTEKLRHGGQYQLLNHLSQPRLWGTVAEELRWLYMVVSFTS
ncbi:hypothetical protein [Streptomyces sp. NPDC056255]|uniref:hypothetical protein n=1 Tax=Streptomyces sp. NPDC056255 TaxID=3345764 RepID=UPI0035DF9B98